MLVVRHIAGSRETEAETCLLPVVAIAAVATRDLRNLLRCRHNMVESWCAICLGYPIMGDGLDLEVILSGVTYAYLRF